MIDANHSYADAMLLSTGTTTSNAEKTLSARSMHVGLYDYVT